MNKDKCCPKYIPDFVKLAESYEARGIRITKEEELKKAFDYALEFKKGPTLIVRDRERGKCIADGADGKNACGYDYGLLRFVKLDLGCVDCTNII